jgi:diguanylate cyclase
VDHILRTRARVWLVSIAGTLTCIAIVVFVDSFNFERMDAAEVQRALTVDIMLPGLLAGPLLFLLLSKIRALAIARDEMTKMASTDSLTAVLNRGAFQMLVDAYLGQTRANSSVGALLIIDADHFKAVNDSLGHQAGDAALISIATTVQSKLRRADIVGRIGGEEFAVFLPGATAGHTHGVAERIRRAVTELPFPRPEEHRLSVSVGGVTFRNERDYERLFKAADQCLYEAKNAGRNQVKIRHYIGGASLAA